MSKEKRSPWLWVPSLYYAEGIPYVVVMMVSVVMYKRLGISNTDIALYTSWLYLPWIIKPFWSPIVDKIKTKRFWILTMQLCIGAGMSGVALTLPLPTFFQLTLAFFWLAAFSSATHDIAADGFYMLGLSQHKQALYVGIRSAFYRLAMITGQGLLIMFAGFIETNSGLDNAELQVVAAVSQKTAIEKMNLSSIQHPDSIRFDHRSEKTQIVFFPNNLSISTMQLDQQSADSLIKFAQKWNIENKFIPPAEENSAERSGSVSWWDENISSPLANYIKENFGNESKKINQYSGNIGLAYLSLSGKPKMNEEITINLGRNSGDKNISLMNQPNICSRLTFNENNWNKNAIVLIHLDPKLKTNANAVFLAQSGNIPLAWSLTFFLLTGVFILFFLYHKIWLPTPAADSPAIWKNNHFLKEFSETFILFFKKEKMGAIIGFLLLFRFSESQLIKLASPFLLDRQEMGGLALTTGEVGFIYGTIGLLFLTFGGLLGGYAAAKKGLKFWLWPMALAINLPNIVYVYLSQHLPDHFWLINLSVAVEQFGYGFGFTAYMLYMIYASQGENKTAHFAITTGFMALGMMLPGMFSGWLQELIGYRNFFIWIMVATIPSFLILFFIPLDKEFGKKNETVRFKK
jgi:PAT family beta-lactamase induction signal transducer AmpG